MRKEMREWIDLALAVVRTGALIYISYLLSTHLLETTGAG